MAVYTMVAFNCTAITEEDADNGFTLHPVPASEWVGLRSTGAARSTRISVLDPMGRIVLQEPVLSHMHRIDVSGFVSGRYVMRVQFGDGSARQRIFVVLQE